MDLAKKAKRCPSGGLTYEPLASVETRGVIEVSVRASVWRVPVPEHACGDQHPAACPADS